MTDSIVLREKARLKNLIFYHPIHRENTNPLKGVEHRVYPASCGEDPKLYKLWHRLRLVNLKLLAVKKPVTTMEQITKLEKRIEKISADYVLWKLESL